MTTLPLTLNEALTHKGNPRNTRFGWLRLTPAYSLKLVADTIDPRSQRVLDPFCGTGTTALLCAEQGIPSATTDINPFLVWLASVKTRRYSSEVLAHFRYQAEKIGVNADASRPGSCWLPPIHEIEKWWDQPVLGYLGYAMAEIRNLEAATTRGVTDLLKIVFCRVMIEMAHVSFGHQSMSFKQRAHPEDLFGIEHELQTRWQNSTQDVFQAAHSSIATEPEVLLIDARQLEQKFQGDSFDQVVTSPPYPNRMSYIRELRPYMYWLGFLNDGRQAGELDWQAIGGTWGCATSNVAKWRSSGSEVPFPEFATILERIAERSRLLSNYVHKYFVDMTRHIASLRNVLKERARVQYIVGNSKFYDVLLPVEQIFAALFSSAGFHEVDIRAIRKRTSKKELFEFIVSAER